MRTALSPQKGKKAKARAKAREKHKQQTTEGVLLGIRRPFQDFEQFGNDEAFGSPSQEKSELLIAKLASWDLHGGLTFNRCSFSS